MLTFNCTTLCHRKRSSPDPGLHIAAQDARKVSELYTQTVHLTGAYLGERGSLTACAWSRGLLEGSPMGCSSQENLADHKSTAELPMHAIILNPSAQISYAGNREAFSVQVQHAQHQLSAVHSAQCPAPCTTGKCFEMNPAPTT